MADRPRSGDGPLPGSAANVLGLIALLQLVTIIGLIVLYLQVGGVPEQTADRVPTPMSGAAADAEVGPIASGVSDLEGQVLALQAKIDVICRALESAQPSGSSPTPCGAP